MNVWIAAALLSAAVLLSLLVPMFRRRQARGGQERGVYQDQIAEIESDKARCLIDAAAAEALAQEIGRRLEDAGEDSDGKAAGPAKSRPLAAAITIAVLVPVLSFAIYGLLGSPQLPGQPHAERRAADTAEQANMRKVVETLAKRMQQSPERLEGWMLLGKSYARLNEYAKAARAFRRASELAPARADIHASLGEALFMAAGQRFDAGSRAAIEAALRVDPRDPKALFYQGAAHLQAGAHARAVQSWIDLIAVSPPDAPWLAGVRRRIASAAEAGGIDAAAVKPRLAPATGSAPAIGPRQKPRGPRQEDVDAASRMSDTDRARFILGMVEQLVTRLREYPDDAPGWRRLARAYKVLGETEKAALAEARAAHIEGGGTASNFPGKTPAN
ncbi:MAG: c-type cytochrome biogenesis protein CcmI [Rhodospirillales bacterium]|nr:c-type cytochrome biogenesis protein CcmI [Rhodospirillales bacterium]